MEKESEVEVEASFTLSTLTTLSTLSPTQDQSEETSRPQSESITTILSEITTSSTKMTSTHQNNTVHRRNNLPRKRLFMNGASKNGNKTGSGSRVNNNNITIGSRNGKSVTKKSLKIIMIGICFIALFFASFTLTSTSPTSAASGSVSGNTPNAPNVKALDASSSLSTHHTTHDKDIENENDPENVDDDGNDTDKDKDKVNIKDNIKDSENGKNMENENENDIHMDIAEASAAAKAAEVQAEAEAEAAISSDTAFSKEKKLKSCSFRTYKPNRYYSVNPQSMNDMEPFLTNAEYIGGKLPFILNPRPSEDELPSVHSSSMPNKLCLDTSDWEDVENAYDFYPFSDGQNPSIVSLSSNVYDIASDNGSNEVHKDRLYPEFIEPLKELYSSDSSSTSSGISSYEFDDLYIGLLLFGDSQCRWNLTKEELETKHFSPLQKAPSKRSMVIILNENNKNDNGGNGSGGMNIIDSTVLQLESDADWGDIKKRKKIRKELMSDGSGNYKKSIVELDDARLFFHQGQLHVLYRNGPYYGYEKQAQNPIHFKKVDNKLEAYIKASETFTICCGRNIAFISELPQPKGNSEEKDDSKNDKNDVLQALTWIDPVTTEIVDTKPQSAVASSSRGRRLNENQNDTQNIVRKNNIDTFEVENSIRRFLKGKKSHIHGTNGYMLPLHSTNELFGIAHFHRPEGRETSDYARHGHHYTHAFFTIQLSKKTNQYILKRLSNEFIFMSPSSSDDQTGDVIQFTSGLDLIGSDVDGRLLLSYGINDCEAATFFMSMDRVQELLNVNDIVEGNEVVNLMKGL